MRPSDDALAPDPVGPTPADIPTRAGGEGPRRFRPLSRWQGAVTALLTGAIVIGACSGDNLWSGDSTATQPKVVGMAVGPKPVSPGDTLIVQVSAYAQRKVGAVEVQLGGAVSRDTVVTVASPAVTAVASVKIPLPVFFSDTLLIIRAIAYDAVGQASRVRSDTASADAPPAVVGFAGPDSIRAGQIMTFQVHAMGVRPITKVRLWLRSALSGQDSILILQPGRDVQDTVMFPAPSVQFNDTLLAVDMQAVDNSGQEGYISRGTVPVAVPAPSIDSVYLPLTASAGTAVPMTIKARSLRTVSKLAIRFSGAINADSLFSVANPGKVVTQTVSVTIPVASQDSILRMSIRAVDKGGVVGVPTDTAVRLATGAPRVDSVAAPDSIRSGTTLDVRVFAHGPRPITQVTLSLRGAYNNDVSVAPTGGARTNVTQDFSIPLSATAADSQLVVNAKVTDGSGAVSNIVSRVVRISDTAPPTVSANLPKPSVAAGRNLGVHIVATDNIGLATLGVSLLDASKSVLSTGTLAVRGRAQDTTVYVAVPLMGSASLTAQAYALDRFNNRTDAPPLQVQVIDSVIPMDSIRSPAVGATYPLGDSVLVTVRAASLVGIRTITLSGVAIRGGGTTSTYVVQRFNGTTVSFPQPPSTRLPHDTVISRWLRAIPDTTSEMVQLVSQVTDSANMVAWDTVQVGVGGPLVQILTPANGASVSVNQPFQVRVYARDKSVGLDSVTVVATGAFRDSLKSGPLSGADTLNLQGNFTSAATGAVTLTARAWNRRGIIGQATPVTFTVATVGTTTDTQRPSVQIASIQYKGVALADFTRVELTDTITVTVKAMDNGGSGVRRIGVTVSAVPSATLPGGPLAPLGLQQKYAPAQAGEVAYAFTFVPRDFVGLNETAATLGKMLNVQLLLTAFAQDAAAPTSYCGATVNLAVYDSLPCAYAFSNGAVPPDSFFTVTGRTPYTKQIMLVGGRTVTLPSGGNIADEVVDEPNRRLYLSNIQQNKIDALRLTDFTFVNTGSSTGLGLVGSQPWGIFLNRRPDPLNPGQFIQDSLFVANSGSTNLSVVVVDTTRADALKEDLNRRIFTPNEILWQVDQQLNNGYIRYTALYFDFSDRPQFVAQDANGRLVYSTVPTQTAKDGTIRYVIPRAAPQKMEPKLLFNAEAIDPGQPSSTAIAFMDSMVVVRGGLPSGDDGVVLYDHTVGYPNDPSHVVVSYGGIPMPLPNAVLWMDTVTVYPKTGAVGSVCTTGQQCSDLVGYAGKWKTDKVGMSDTTFLAASGDRNWIALGEGAASPARVIMWDGSSPTNVGISSDVSVQDLMNNASERVYGLGLNSNGTLGVARGLFGAYFFMPDLRLQGMYATPGGAGGAAMHPDGNSVTDTNNGLSFVATSNKSIQAIDAVHFYLRGEIQLRDQVVGPVKAGHALPGENPVGMLTTDPNYIVAKLYCVTATASGQTQVVMINVRNKDLTN